MDALFCFEIYKKKTFTRRERCIWSTVRICVLLLITPSERSHTIHHQRTIRCRSTRTHYPASEPTKYLFLQINAGCLKKSNRYQFYSLGLTRSGLKPMTHLTQDHHANNYTIDAVPEYWQYKL
jgi:hypothetical protein